MRGTMQDILFKTDSHVFSYRVSGILIHDGKILLQKPENDDYALPGGHVAFEETAAEALVREFKEETGANIRVERLLLLGENFFPWGDRRCQQVSLYFRVSLCDETQIPLEGSFKAYDELDKQRIGINFCWVPLSELRQITLYPLGIAEDILSEPDTVKHFVYKE